MNHWAEKALDFGRFTLATIGPALVIAIGVALAAVSGRTGDGWVALSAYVVIGLALGWATSIAEARGERRIILRMLEALQPQKAGGGE
ncbi:hypothetical protein ACT6QG_05525 [Xanthobacter sp. TB0136]|uniref:hypothetical protein n=1 Tax=Xanthobacter sp. TB0136 TaxID=3459177 RepID=UPI004038FB55